MKSMILAITFICCQTVFGQSFQGTLTYVTSVEISPKMEKMGMTKESLIEQMKKDGSWADTIKVVYKQGDYYTLPNSKPKSWAIYKAATNKIYSMQDGEAKDLCTVTDASIDLEFQMMGKMPTVQKLDTTVMIDNMPCGIVRVKWKTGSYDYYFNSSKLMVNAGLFSKHVYDGWAEYLKISNSLPLRIVRKTNGVMTLTMSLISSKEEEVSDKFFVIPTLIADKDLNLIKTGNKETMRIKH
jgi:hypothetical protein